MLMHYRNAYIFLRQLASPLNSIEDGTDPVPSNRVTAVCTYPVIDKELVDITGYQNIRLISFGNVQGLKNKQNVRHKPDSCQRDLNTLLFCPKLPEIYQSWRDHEEETSATDYEWHHQLIVYTPTLFANTHSRLAHKTVALSLFE